MSTHRKRTPPLFFSSKSWVAYTIYRSKPELLPNFFFLILKTSFQKKEKSHPVAEHRLSAIHLPLLNVCREKISSHSGLKSRVEKILCSFGVSMEGEYILELFSVVCFHLDICDNMNKLNIFNGNTLLHLI